MKIFYRTGWPDASIHFCPHGDSGTWRTEPMSDVPGAPGWKVTTLSCAPRGAEFVMRNGAGTQWDNPPPEVGGTNYKTPVAEGDWSLRHGRLMRLSNYEPVLIVSDLDHTMVGHEHDPENRHLREFQSVWMGRFAFNGSHLVYSTGRNKADALKVAIERGLLRPSLLICGVGTEVYDVPEDLPLEDGKWAESADRITLDPSWRAKMEGTFDRTRVEAILQSRFPKFEMRGNPATDPYRIPTAYQVDPAWQENLRTVREALGAGVEVITSGGNEWKLVDFCSAEAGKMKACEFAISRLSIPAERTLVCGDSGNDESMYRCPGVKGVAVGNSLSELLEALRGMADAGPEAVRQGAAFKTRVGSSVLWAQRPVASAIVEALEHFWPERR